MPVAQDGTVYPFWAGPGIGPQDALTQGNALGGFMSMSGMRDPAATTLAADEGDEPTSYGWYLLGIIALLAAFKFASEHEKTAMEPKFMSIGLYNWMAGGIMALSFIVVAKIAINKVPGFKGLTDIVNMV